jgi:hypothetical protein
MKMRKLVKKLKMIIQKASIKQDQKIMTPDRYIQSIKSTESTISAMADEMTILQILSWVTGYHLTSYEDIIELGNSQISLYDIPEEKKEFNIETVRQCIAAISLAPYTGKNISILRHFDTATLSAQNALLKILEDCPPYAVILLEVNNPSTLLETIRSRTIDLVAFTRMAAVTPEHDQIIQAYRSWDQKALLRSLFAIKCTSIEAISILRGVYPYLIASDMTRCDTAIESLATTHENPRTVLDIFFL